MTFPIPGDRGLNGDTCGCCDGICPQPGEEIFERPDFVEKSCEAKRVIVCDIPHRRGKIDRKKKASFVCHEMFKRANPNKKPFAFPRIALGKRTTEAAMKKIAPSTPLPLTLSVPKKRKFASCVMDKRIFCSHIHHLAKPKDIA
jgi:hypothetical protein